MKTKIKLILLLLISITSFAQIDTGLQSYYDSFLADAASRDVTLDLSYTLKMKLVRSEIEYQGISIIDSENSELRILINQNAWDTLTATEKKIIAYHELGHSILHRKHQNHNLSLMNINAVTESIYLANETDLLNELFLPFGDTISNFKKPIGSPSDNNSTINFNTGDLIFVSKGWDYPLKPFLVDARDENNEIYFLATGQIYLASVVDLRDKSKMVIKDGKIIQIRSTYGGISLSQVNPLYQPKWNESTQTAYFPENTYFEYNCDCLNVSFDSTPFKDVFMHEKHRSFSGPIKIGYKMNRWTGRIIVIFYEKPYIQNHE